MLRLVGRNILKHPIRSMLTVGSLVVALFLLCVLISLVRALDAGVRAADAGRLWVQSAVSLFVAMPTSYQAQIEAVDGVEDTCKWQWFGGYYQEQSNFFAQFACDPRELLEIYPECEIAEGSADEFFRKRSSCIVGRGLADEFDWEIGDTVPIIGALFPKPGGAAWEFEVAAIYESKKASFDNRTLFFHWDLFEQTMLEIDGEEPDVGAMVIQLKEGAAPSSVMSDVDALYENGPQRVQTTTEAEFFRQFVSMVGNLPRLIAFIGGGVFVAILLACVNTMLMAGREQIRDIGILKALGFDDGTMFRLLLGQSLLLCAAGGALGILLAVLTQFPIAQMISRFFPGYVVEPSTIGVGIAITLAVGLIAGIVPAWRARALSCVEALRRGA